jgi:hypothetical protein
MTIDSFIIIINGIVLFYLFINKYGYSSMYLNLLILSIIGAYYVNRMIMGYGSEYAKLYILGINIYTNYCYLS